jgi:small-conductance mechanosensitive channel/CRP-like cAMP-binding protein
VDPVTAMREQWFRKLFWPTILLVAVLLIGWNWLNLEEWTKASSSMDSKVVRAIFGVVLAWLGVRLIDVLVWRLIELRIETSIPRLLKDSVAAIVFLIAFILIVAVVFQKPVTGIWATSGVVGVVLGFALQSMIADVFCGIAINVDQPFKIGQWVKLVPRGVETMVGCVTEISWRCTRLRSKENTMIVVPNSMISTMIVTNLSEPDRNTRFQLEFCLDFGVPTERALRVLSAGVMAAGGILSNPRPKARVTRVTERGVLYRVRYWLDPVDTSPSKGRHAVISSILRHLHQAGITLAYEKHDVFVSKMPSRQLDRLTDRTSIVRRIEIFSGLDSKEMEWLAGRLKERRIGFGVPIVKQGDAGSSMYVLVEGLLDVRAGLEKSENQVSVKSIQPGEFFGEMSLLTGEPRTATVVAVTDAIVYEIHKEDIEGLLETRPEIAVQISQIIAARRQDLQTIGSASGGEKHESQQTFADQILDRMKNVFGSLRDGLGFRRSGRPDSK